MRNVGKTPTKRLEQKETNSEKTSGKKLVQARLPFKIIALSSTATGVGLTDTGIDGGGETATFPSTDSGGDSFTNEVRKRKLSYNEVSTTEEEQDCTPAKENFSTIRTKKKKITSSTTANAVEEEVILLGDSDGEEKEKKQNDAKKAINVSTKAVTSPKSPMNKSQKRKGAGTSKSANASSSGGGSVGVGCGVAGGSSTKLQIKLPLCGTKKRRKSQRKSKTETDGAHLEQSFAESGDDIEIIASELNPEKRPKVEEGGNEKAALVKENYEQKKNVDNKNVIAENMEEQDTKNKPHNTTKPIIKETPTKTEDCRKSIHKRSKLAESFTNTEIDPADAINIDSDSDNDKPSNKKATLRTSTTRKSLKTLDAFVAKKGTTNKQKTVNNDRKAVDSKKHKTNTTLFKTSDLKSVSADADDVETDDAEIANSSASSTVDDNIKDGKSSIKSDPKVFGSPAPNSPLTGNSISSKQLKNLTPKQERLMEQRKKAREDKERRLQDQKEERDRKQQEERHQKQLEKEEKELAKKREREEKEEQKRKEREDKEEIKRKDREEKEHKRLAEIEAKNEERRKRNEVKEEELRKKEEERKRKEQEKEEAENKKKKAAEAFTKFFVPKSNQRVKIAGAEDGDQKIVANDGVEKAYSNEVLAFRPFQVKGDMQLAPICRKDFSNTARGSLDSFLCDSTQKGLPEKSKLYLCELKMGKMQPGKWRRPTVDVKPDDEDVIIVEDELERAAQAIVDEHASAVERYRAKFFKFHENRRPPFFGTWRKKTNVITPRRPLTQDNKYFDYEVDSDLEWEEEEPGESLDGSDDEKEKESEDDDYEVDNEWFVPHGHLSDEEMQNEDECGLGDDNTREAQKAKLKILQQEFAQEMKKKTEKIKPRLIGIIWQDYNGNQPELCPNIIWKSLNLRAMLCISAPIIEEPIVTESTNDAVEPNSPSTSTSGGQTDKKKPIALTEKMLIDLIRLVHGNRHKKDFIIKEFIAFVEQTEESIKNGDARGPLKSVVREKIDEFALWQIIELNSNSKNKKNKKKLCWLVSDEILKKYDMQSIDLHNTWTYTLQPKFVDAKTEHSDKSTKLIEEDSVEATTASSEKGSPTSLQKKMKKKKCDVITKFTKVLTAEEKAQQLQQKSESPKVSLAAKSRKITQAVRSPMLHKKTESNNPAAAAKPKASSSASIVKKRVPLLMSVERGQQISTPVKNALISQFVQKSKEEAKEKADLVSKLKSAASTQMEIDDVIVLD